MKGAVRWDPCVAHRRGQVEEFVKSYLSNNDRRVLLIAGAGFDPRTLVVAQLLTAVVGDRLRLVLLREIRPSPAEHLLTRAEKHIQTLSALCPDMTLHKVRAFADDDAVILGESILKVIRQVSFKDITDIVVDWSALSIGSAFPLVRFLLGRTNRSTEPTNLHIMVVASSPVDHAITRLDGGDATLIRGYEGKLEMEAMSTAARIWVPQLRHGVGPQLENMYRYLNAKDRLPHDVMPILPFPAHHPRLPDKLLAEFYSQLHEWNVHQSDVAYAAEDDPLDLYRQLVKLDDLRKQVFTPNRPSQVILSPIGSKLLAVGAMMAAIEKDMPVLYVEAPDFRAEPAALDSPKYSDKDIVHLWLAGDAYPSSDGVSLETRKPEQPETHGA